MTQTKLEKQIEWLLQKDWIEKIIPSIGKTPWIRVYESRITEIENYGIFSALIPNDLVQQTLREPEWDLSTGDGHPGCWTSYGEGEMEHVSYHRHGDDSGIEPFVINRIFHGARPDYNEIIEEFRLFHSLYHDTEKCQLFSFDEAGDETLIARVEPDLVEIRAKELRQFLAIRAMHLAIFFDVKRFSPLNIHKLPEGSVPIEFNRDLIRYTLYADSADLAPHNGHNSWSRLLGKKLIAGFSREQSGVWPYTKKKKECVDFIIGVDENSEEVLHSSGANQPYYLAPVFFRREVLTKYYASPERYSVEDGYLRCQGLWGVQIDNNHHEYVIVFLGDLGRDLPYKEQLYWRSYNVAPQGHISQVNFRRSFLAEFADPEQIDLIFKSDYSVFNVDWESNFGWPLFLPLAEGDRHLYVALHVPLTEEQSEFDTQVLALTKILIDSLNEQGIEGASPPYDRDLKGSISKVEWFLKNSNFEFEKYVQFLRNLQSLRSAGVGHRKGSNYEKIAASLGLKAKTRQLVFQKLLEQAVEFLTVLRQHFLA
jgi:hypothetical protein